MGNKLTVSLRSGITNVSLVVLNGSAEWWNTSGAPAFEAYNAANIADYDTAGAETGSTGIYVFTFPAGITAGQYTVLVVEQAGANLAETDFPAMGTHTVEWDGAAFVLLSAIEAVTDALTAAAATKLALSAGTIVVGTVDTVTNGHTPTRTEFQADDITTAAPDHYIGRIVIFTSGSLQNQASDITDYVLVGGIGQFTVTEMTAAAANNNTFVIV